MTIMELANEMPTWPRHVRGSSWINRDLRTKYAVLVAYDSWGHCFGAGLGNRSRHLRKAPFSWCSSDISDIKLSSDISWLNSHELNPFVLQKSHILLFFPLSSRIFPIANWWWSVIRSLEMPAILGVPTPTCAYPRANWTSFARARQVAHCAALGFSIFLGGQLHG